MSFFSLSHSHPMEIREICYKHNKIWDILAFCGKFGSSGLYNF